MDKKFSFLIGLLFSLTFFIESSLSSYAASVVVPLNDVPNYTTNYYCMYYEVVPYNSGVLYRGYSYGLIDPSDTVSVITEIDSSGFEVYRLRCEHGFYSRYFSQFGDLIFTQNVILDNEVERLVDVQWGSNNPEYQYFYKYASSNPGYDPSIPSPIGIFGQNSKGDFDHTFTLQNRDNYGVLIKLRWHSVDDVIFQGHSGTIKVSVNFQTVLDGPLRDLYTIDSPYTLDSFDIDSIGSTSFEDFLLAYDPDDRHISQFNYQGKEVTLYNTAVTHFISSLSHSDFYYNCPEIYLAYTDGESIGSWSQFYIDLVTGETYSQNAIRPFGDNGNSSFSNQTGLTPDQMESLSGSSNSIYNPNASSTSSGNSYDFSDNVNVPDGLISTINSFIGIVNSVLGLINTLFSFLPQWVSMMVSVSIGALVAIGFLDKLT